jgi:signal transduction histidine kinase
MLACAGKGRFVVRSLSLNDLVADTISVLQLSVPKEAHLVGEVAPGLPLVNGDASQFGQIVMNLMKNACDALAGGRCTITMRRSGSSTPTTRARFGSDTSGRRRGRY